MKTEGSIGTREKVCMGLNMHSNAISAWEIKNLMNDISLGGK